MPEVKLFKHVDTWKVIDAVYFVVVSLTTVGIAFQIIIYTNLKVFIIYTIIYYVTITQFFTITDRYVMRKILIEPCNIVAKSITSL